MVEVSAGKEEVKVVSFPTKNELQTVAMFNTRTSELISFSFTLEDVFNRERWDDVAINRKMIQLKKRA